MVTEVKTNRSRPLRSQSFAKFKNRSKSLSPEIEDVAPAGGQLPCTARRVTSGNDIAPSRNLENLKRKLRKSGYSDNVDEQSMELVEKLLADTLRGANNFSRIAMDYDAFKSQHRQCQQNSCLAAPAASQATSSSPRVPTENYKHTEKALRQKCVRLERLASTILYVATKALKIEALGIGHEGKECPKDGDQQQPSINRNAGPTFSLTSLSLLSMLLRMEDEHEANKGHHLSNKTVPPGQRDFFDAWKIAQERDELKQKLKDAEDHCLEMACLATSQHSEVKVSSEQLLTSGLEAARQWARDAEITMINNIEALRARIESIIDGCSSTNLGRLTGCPEDILEKCLSLERENRDLREIMQEHQHSRGRLAVGLLPRHDVKLHPRSKSANALRDNIADCAECDRLRLGSNRRSVSFDCEKCILEGNRIRATESDPVSEKSSSETWKMKTRSELIDDLVKVHKQVALLSETCLNAETNQKKMLAELEAASQESQGDKRLISRLTKESSAIADNLEKYQHQAMVENRRYRELEALYLDLKDKAFVQAEEHKLLDETVVTLYSRLEEERCKFEEASAELERMENVSRDALDRQSQLDFYRNELRAIEAMLRMRQRSGEEQIQREGEAILEDSEPFPVVERLEHEFLLEEQVISEMDTELTSLRDERDKLLAHLDALRIEKDTLAAEQASERNDMKNVKVSLARLNERHEILLAEFETLLGREKHRTLNDSFGSASQPSKDRDLNGKDNNSSPPSIIKQGTRESDYAREVEIYRRLKEEAFAEKKIAFVKCRQALDNARTLESKCKKMEESHRLLQKQLNIYVERCRKLENLLLGQRANFCALETTLSRMVASSKASGTPYDGGLTPMSQFRGGFISGRPSSISLMEQPTSSAADTFSADVRSFTDDTHTASANNFINRMETFIGSSSEFTTNTAITRSQTPGYQSESYKSNSENSMRIGGGGTCANGSSQPSTVLTSEAYTCSSGFAGQDFAATGTRDAKFEEEEDNNGTIPNNGSLSLRIMTTTTAEDDGPSRTTVLPARLRIEEAGLGQNSRSISAPLQPTLQLVPPQSVPVNGIVSLNTSSCLIDPTPQPVIGHSSSGAVTLNESHQTSERMGSNHHHFMAVTPVRIQLERPSTPYSDSSSEAEVRQESDYDTHLKWIQSKDGGASGGRKLSASMLTEDFRINQERVSLNRIDELTPPSDSENLAGTMKDSNKKRTTLQEDLCTLRRSGLSVNDELRAWVIANQSISSQRSCSTAANIIREGSSLSKAQLVAGLGDSVYSNLGSTPLLMEPRKSPQRTQSTGNRVPLDQRSQLVKLPEASSGGQYYKSQDDDAGKQQKGDDAAYAKFARIPTYDKSGLPRFDESSSCSTSSLSLSSRIDEPGWAGVSRVQNYVRNSSTLKTLRTGTELHRLSEPSSQLSIGNESVVSVLTAFGVSGENRQQQQPQQNPLSSRNTLIPSDRGKSSILLGLSSSGSSSGCTLSDGFWRLTPSSAQTGMSASTKVIEPKQRHDADLAFLSSSNASSAAKPRGRSFEAEGEHLR